MVKMSGAGERITTIARPRFLELWAGLEDGTLEKRWPKGKRASTKAEKVEQRQLSVMAALIMEDYPTFNKLLKSDEWNEVEFIRAKDGSVLVRAKRVSPRRARGGW